MKVTSPVHIMDICKIHSDHHLAPGLNLFKFIHIQEQRLREKEEL